MEQWECRAGELFPFCLNDQTFALYCMLLQRMMEYNHFYLIVYCSCTGRRTYKRDSKLWNILSLKVMICINGLLSLLFSLALLSIAFKQILVLLALVSLGKNVIYFHCALVRFFMLLRQLCLMEVGTTLSLLLFGRFKGKLMRRRREMYLKYFQKVIWYFHHLFHGKYRGFPIQKFARRSTTSCFYLL